MSDENSREWMTQERYECAPETLAIRELAQAAFTSNILPRHISFKHALPLWLACYRQKIKGDVVDVVLVAMAQKK